MSSLIYSALWHFISLQGEGGGTVVYNLEATDEDEGNNKKLTYAITSGNNGEFILNSNTGVLQISPTGLDRELHSSYNLTINVTDAGNPVLWVGTKGCRPSSLIICDLRIFIYLCSSPLWYHISLTSAHRFDSKPLHFCLYAEGNWKRSFV